MVFEPIGLNINEETPLDEYYDQLLGQAKALNVPPTNAEDITQPADMVVFLERYHPDLAYFLNEFAVLPQATRRTLQWITREMILDQLATGVVDEVKDTTSKTFTALVYKDSRDFVGGLRINGLDFSLVKVEAPGVGKMANTDGGYAKGNRVIREMLNRTLRTLVHEGYTNLYILRRGSEFFVAIAKADIAGREESVVSALREGLIRPGLIEGYPMMPAVSIAPLELVSHKEEAASDARINLDRLSHAFQKLRESNWRAFIVELNRRVDIDFVARYFYPVVDPKIEKRGPDRLVRLGATREEIQAMQVNLREGKDGWKGQILVLLARAREVFAKNITNDWLQEALAAREITLEGKSFFLRPLTDTSEETAWRTGTYGFSDEKTTFVFHGTNIESLPTLAKYGVFGIPGNHTISRSFGGEVRNAARNRDSALGYGIIAVWKVPWSDVEDTKDSLAEDPTGVPTQRYEGDRAALTFLPDDLQNHPDLRNLPADNLIGFYVIESSEKTDLRVQQAPPYKRRLLAANWTRWYNVEIPSMSTFGSVDNETAKPLWQEIAAIRQQIEGLVQEAYPAEAERKKFLDGIAQRFMAEAVDMKAQPNAEFNRDCFAFDFVGAVYADDASAKPSCRPWYMSPFRMVRYIREHPEVIKKASAQVIRFGAKGTDTDWCRKNKLACTVLETGRLGGIIYALWNITDWVIPYVVENSCGLNQIEMWEYRMSLMYGFTPPKDITEKIQSCDASKQTQISLVSPIVDRRSEWRCTGEQQDNKAFECSEFRDCIDTERGLQAHHGRTFVYNNAPMICVDGQFTQITEAKCTDATSLAVGYSDRVERIACAAGCSVNSTTGGMDLCGLGELQDSSPSIFTYAPNTDRTCLNTTTLYMRRGSESNLRVCSAGCSSTTNACFEDVVFSETLKPYEYFCVNSTTVGQKLPSGQLIELGHCFSGTNERCVPETGMCLPPGKLIAPGEYRLASDGTILPIEYTGLSWKTAGLMLSDYGAMFSINPSEIGVTRWSGVEMDTIYAMCQELPVYFCSGATFTKSATPNSDHPDAIGIATNVQLPGVWIRSDGVNNETIIHELLHDVVDIYGNISPNPPSYDWMQNYQIYNEYVVLTGWSFDTEKQEWKIARPEIGLDNTHFGYANKNPAEHFATLGAEFVQSSVEFAHNYDFKYPGLYEFFRDKVFTGREYRGYQCISGCN